MTDDGIPTEVVEILDFESAVHQMALQGISFREIAKRFKAPIKRVREVVEMMCTPITVETRAQLLRLELDRCDAFQAALYPAAANGDPVAISTSLRVMEHRSAIAGLFAANSARINPVETIVEGKPLNTTERIQHVLDELAKPRLIAGKDVDAADGADSAPVEKKADTA